MPTTAPRRLKQLSGLQTPASWCIMGSLRPLRNVHILIPTLIPDTRDLLTAPSFFRYYQTTSINVLKCPHMRPTLRKKIQLGIFACITYCNQAELFQFILSVNIFSYFNKKKWTTKNYMSRHEVHDSKLVFASIHISCHIDQAPIA